MAVHGTEEQQCEPSLGLAVLLEVDGKAENAHWRRRVPHPRRVFVLAPRVGEHEP